MVITGVATSSLLGFSEGQSGCGDVRLEDRDPAAQIGHHDAGRINLAVELDGQVLRIVCHREDRVERAGRVDEKAGPGEVSMLIGPAHLHHGFAGFFEDLLYLAADRAGGSFRCARWFRRGRRGRAGCLLSANEGDARKKREGNREGERHCRENKSAVWKTAAPCRQPRTGKLLHNSLAYYRARNAEALRPGEFWSCL